MRALSMQRAHAIRCAALLQPTLACPASLTRSLHSHRSSRAAASSPPTAAAASPSTPATDFEAAFPPCVSSRFALSHADARDERSFALLRRLSSVSAGHSPDLPPAPFDLLLTDPPYCLLTSRKDGAPREATSRKKLLHDPTGAASTLRFTSQGEYARFCHEWLSALAPHMSPQAPWVIWTNHLGRAPIQEAVRRVAGPDMRLWNEVLWVKPARPQQSARATRAQNTQHTVASPYEPITASPVTPSSALSTAATAPWVHTSPPPLSLPLSSPELSFRAYECALVFGRGTFEQWQLASGQQWTREQPSVIACPYEDEVAAPGAPADDPASPSTLLHPNCKPLRVLLPLLHTYTSPGALVLDPFGGSGAHAHAALSSGRRAATLELNPLWARHIRDTVGATMNAEDRRQRG